MGSARIVLALFRRWVFWLHAAAARRSPAARRPPLRLFRRRLQTSSPFRRHRASRRRHVGRRRPNLVHRVCEVEDGAALNSGKVQEVVTPSKNVEPNGIASGPGPNLNVWFTESNIGKVAQITVAGPPYTEYKLPDPAARPVSIALGSDGNMWITDPGTNSVWRVKQISQTARELYTVPSHRQRAARGQLRTVLTVRSGSPSPASTASDDCKSTALRSPSTPLPRRTAIRWALRRAPTTRSGLPSRRPSRSGGCRRPAP